MTISVPETIFAGDTIVFDVPAFTDSIGNSVDSGSYTLTWYARTNVSAQGANITGAAEGDGGCRQSSQGRRGGCRQGQEQALIVISPRLYLCL